MGTTYPTEMASYTVTDSTAGSVKFPQQGLVAAKVKFLVDTAVGDIQVQLFDNADDSLPARIVHLSRAQVDALIAIVQTVVV